MASLSAKMALAHVSTKLVTGSLSEREEFSKDPAAYVKKIYGHEPTAEENEQLSKLGQTFAEGTCCGGCGC